MNSKRKRKRKRPPEPPREVAHPQPVPPTETGQLRPRPSDVSEPAVSRHPFQALHAGLPIKSAPFDRFADGLQRPARAAVFVPPPDERKASKFPFRFALFFLLLALILNVALRGSMFPAHAAELQPPAGIGPPQTETAETRRRRMEAAVETERENLTAMGERVEQMTAEAERIRARLDEFDVQMTSHGNLFLMEDASLTRLERAWSEHVAARKSVEGFLSSAEKNLAWIQEQVRDIRGRSELYASDLEDRPIVEGVEGIGDSAGKIQALLDEKVELLERVRTRYGERIVPRLREFAARLSGFSERFEARLKERRTRLLFERGDSGATFLQELRSLTRPQTILLRARNVLEREVQGLTLRLETVGHFFLFAFLLMFASVEYGVLRIRRTCLRKEAAHDLARRWPWGRLALRTFAEGLPLMGATLYLYLYAQIRDLWLTTTIFRIAFFILGVWMVAQWFSSFLNMREEMAPEGSLSRSKGMLRKLLFIFRVFIPILVLFIWLMGRSVALQTTARLVFDLILLAWISRFWKHFQTGPDGKPRPIHQWPLRVRVLKAFSYFIPAFGIVLILLGFFSLSLYWSTSWLLTFPLLLWGGVTLQLLREWRRRFNAENARLPAGDDSRSPRLLQWLLLQISWLAWAALGIPLLVFAWYVDKPAFFQRAFSLLAAPLPVEGLRISFVGIFSAILVVLLTHAAVRVGKPLIQDRFLADSGMNRGARTSITLIAAYGFWALGFLIALNVLGVQSGHLAVVFGALGLGLGFGLQNIFNNFISGIILLFERPIQVGDVVEINGTWAEVRNINVRATQVQTYDNASLLIPNSEFVSSTVINWSFKDLRIRRNIYVGVAYGSDIERVRDTMLEIARSAEFVLRYPEPLVYFSDFGDSALIFRLRFWTDVDNCLAAETNIRFAIDRLFRERGIEIAFPQRDLHIRTVAGASFAPVPSRTPAPEAPSASGPFENTPAPRAAQPAGSGSGTHSDPAPEDDAGEDSPSGP